MAYTDAKVGPLDRALRELLEEHKVQEVVAIWLAEQGITQIEAFSDLAESKNEIVEAVASKNTPHLTLCTWR